MWPAVGGAASLSLSLSFLSYPTNEKKTKGKGNEQNKRQKANNFIETNFLYDIQK